MNIAFYAPMKPPDDDIPSGDLRMSHALVSALDEYGHRVEIASSFRSREPEGSPVKQEIMRSEGAMIARDLISKYSLRGKRPDLWFTYHVYYKAPDWIGPLVAQTLRIPYVVAEASHAPKRAGGPWDLSYQHVMRTIQEADLVIGLNSVDAKCIRPLLRSADMYLQLKPFLDLPSYCPAEKAELRYKYAENFDLDVSKVWFLTAAMMRKGAKQRSYEILSRSLNLIDQSRWCLFVAGDGPSRQEIEYMFNDLPVFFMGKMDQEALSKLMSATDAFLWPAVDEAYGMAMLEAQSLGLPVVAGNSGGVSNIVRDGVTGKLTELDNAESFSKAIVDLMADPVKLSKMGKQARHTVEREHSIKEASQQINTALMRLVDG